MAVAAAWQAPKPSARATIRPGSLEKNRHLIG
jgi:hypothetical protein